MQEIPEVIKAWAAGFYDGEGYVNISLQSSTHKTGIKYTHYRMRLQITQVDPQPLKVLQSHWGGTLTSKILEKHNTRVINTLVLRSRMAKKFMQDIYQFSQRDIVRRRFDVALEFQNEATINGNKQRSAAYIKRMERLRLKLKELNKRGLEGEFYNQRLTSIDIDPQLSLTLGREQ